MAMGPWLVAIAMLAAPSQADLAAARDAYHKGKELFDSDAHEAALVFFRKAYELSEHRASTVKALAQCEFKLKRFEDALEHFEEYLRIAPETERGRVAETILVLQELVEARTADAERNAKEAAQNEAVPNEAAPAEPPRVERPAPPPVVSTAEVVAAPPEPDGGVLTSPWLWIAVGVAAVGGAVAAGVAVTSGPSFHGGSTGTTLVSR